MLMEVPNWLRRLVRGQEPGYTRITAANTSAIQGKTAQMTVMNHKTTIVCQRLARLLGQRYFFHHF